MVDKSSSAFDEVTSETEPSQKATQSGRQATSGDSSNENNGVSEDDHEQVAVYPTAETWNKFDDWQFETRNALRQNHDTRNVLKREIHEAAFQVMIEEVDPEAVAEKVEELRDEP